MKTLKIAVLIAASFGLTALMSCSNDSISDRATYLTTTAITAGKAESVNDLAVHHANVYVNYLASIKNYDPKDSIYSDPSNAIFTLKIDGVTISIDKKDRKKYPKKIHIDFGTAGVTLKQGNVLKGQIDVIESADMSVAKSSRTFSFSGFSVNNIAIKGINTVTYMGLNADSLPYWKIKVNDSVVFADGATSTWNSERIRTRIHQSDFSSGNNHDDYEVSLDSIRYDNNNSRDNDENNPLMYWVDTYSISGSSSGVNEKGEAYLMSVNDAHPLIIGDGFPFFTKGKEIITSGRNTQVIDFGDGTKDFNVTSTLNGVSINFNK